MRQRSKQENLCVKTTTHTDLYHQLFQGWNLSNSGVHYTELAFLRD